MHLSRHPTSYPTRYQEIAARLEQELRHHYRCGDYLPAEQQLATRFDVNRHTLRRLSTSWLSAAGFSAVRAWVCWC
ncbi:GntR family transcriptional regulator [Klebsiella pneumoniae]|uniref:GntR family transcriptional regulator n=1 Tax=Klebsiella pneumoniae TaxID=573 RepID=A0A377USZ7_KLEPN|nr:GntR family transcriptional regulator [Klebsiella pneumoniae]